MVRVYNIPATLVHVYNVPFLGQELAVIYMYVCMHTYVYVEDDYAAVLTVVP